MNYLRLMTAEELLLLSIFCPELMDLIDMELDRRAGLVTVVTTVVLIY